MSKTRERREHSLIRVQPHVGFHVSRKQRVNRLSQGNDYLFAKDMTVIILPPADVFLNWRKLEIRNRPKKRNAGWTLTASNQWVVCGRCFRKTFSSMCSLTADVFFSSSGPFCLSWPTITDFCQTVPKRDEERIRLETKKSGNRGRCRKLSLWIHRPFSSATRLTEDEPENVEANVFRNLWTIVPLSCKHVKDERDQSLIWRLMIPYVNHLCQITCHTEQTGHGSISCR